VLSMLVCLSDVDGVTAPVRFDAFVTPADCLVSPQGPNEVCNRWVHNFLAHQDSGSGALGSQGVVVEDKKSGLVT
jgi:hypothetical protein